MSEVARKVVRTRKRGLKDIHIAEVTENSPGKYTATKIIKLARALSAKISDKFTQEKIYSDDSVEEIIQTYEGSEIDINVNALAPQDKEIILGHLYKHGFLLKAAGDQAKEIAIGWRAKKGNGKYEFVWYYCGKFAEGMDENYETQEDKTKTQTASLKGSFYARQKEDDIEGEKKNLYAIVVDEENLIDEDTTAKEAIENWFTQVPEYAAPVVGADVEVIDITKELSNTPVEEVEPVDEEVTEVVKEEKKKIGVDSVRA